MKRVVVFYALVPSYVSEGNAQSTLHKQDDQTRILVRNETQPYGKVSQTSPQTLKCGRYSIHSNMLTFTQSPTASGPHITNRCVDMRL